MSATITWVITALDCIPQTPEGANYVVTAHWSCNGTEVQNNQTYNSSVYSTTSFTVTQGSSFVPYASLTQDIVLGWIWESGVNQQTTEAAVQTQLNNQINPPVVSPPLPWAAK